MLRIDSLSVSEAVADKIVRKHNLQEWEVDQALAQDPPTLQLRRGREGLLLVLSRTEGGRYLLIVLAPAGGADWRLVTARDMDDNDRRWYRSQGGR